MMRRRNLPVLSCPLVEQVVADGGHCRRCDEQVHDLSAMTERQARRFLRRHEGGSICVAYRVTPNGRIRFRPSETSRTVQALSLPLVLLSVGGLGGCASLGRDLEVPDDITCLHHRGHRVDCDAPAFAGYDWTPDAVEPTERTELARRDAVDGPADDGLDSPAELDFDSAWADPMTQEDQDDQAQDESTAVHDSVRHYPGDIVMGGAYTPRMGRQNARAERMRRRAERRARRRASRGG
jgi:hypothetical protein